ncbi:hypothetical protein BD410DRAFT_791290 [Rickenella mellea]|uniref:Uncharacterized protein n=1 Tax=Rickenella mellea TaxID=50990 RepID=A0A4Y7PYU6_9AGAM|nr:hypothetical protein BD410DRAFT_791290 [Rickenella mellea]
MPIISRFRCTNNASTTRVPEEIHKRTYSATDCHRYIHILWVLANMLHCFEQIPKRQSWVFV